jgi:hypothetical protein
MKSEAYIRLEKVVATIKELTDKTNKGLMAEGVNEHWEWAFAELEELHQSAELTTEEFLELTQPKDGSIFIANRNETQ